ncbi:MAG: PQQ-binding-like beta-propeller repeat protein, partial [Pseudomonadota bacterium]
MRFFYLFVGLLGILSTAKASPYLSRQWTRSTLDSPYYGFRNQNGMAPLLTKDLVIQGNAIDGIKAFHRKTGNEVWSRQLFNGVEGGAAIDDEVLYFGSNNGQFYAVDVNSGKTLWKFMLNSESLTHPLVAGEAVYHVTGNNTLYAFNKKSGETLWVKTNAAKSNMTVRGQTAPVLENGILYLGFSDGSFSAINAIN